MKVILREEVKSLGQIGSVVNVADGYAVNYLLPRGMAVEADTKNLKAFEHEKRVVMQRAKKLEVKARAFADNISSLTVTLTAKAGEEEKIFGSITSKDIAEALKAQGVDVDKKKILLDEPIKRLGSYEVGVKVSSDVTASIKVEVVAE